MSQQLAQKRPPQQQVSAPQQRAVPTPSVAAAPPAINLPSPKTMVNAARLSLSAENSPPISLDYWLDSRNNIACIGVNNTHKQVPSAKQEKKLYKNADEHTSPIENIYPAYAAAPGEPPCAEYLVVTKNTIYIVSSKIERRYVTFPIEYDDDER